MSGLFCTLGFLSNTTDEEKLEQSNERIAAATELAEYLDMPSEFSVKKLLGKVLKYFESKKDMDLEESYSYVIDFEKYVKNEYIKAIKEQQKAELKTKMLFLMYKEINYCFDTHKRTVEKKFPNHTKKTIEKAIAQAYYALDVIRSGRSILDFLHIHPDKIYEISKTGDYKGFVFFEDFVRENKVNTKNLKRMIEFLKNKEALSLETAYEKAKEEAQFKKKINQGDEMAIRKLKWNYKIMTKCWVATNKKMEEVNAQFEELKKVNCKTIKQNETLVENFNNFVSQIINLDKSEFTKNFYNEFQKMRTELKKVDVNVSALENLIIQNEAIATNTEKNCVKDFTETT